jgi:hypothetical protein
MGAKDWMLVYAAGDVGAALRSTPALDRAATRDLIGRLYPGARIIPTEDGSLASANPAGGVVLAGCFPGVTIVCTEDAALDRPSLLARQFLEEARGRTLYLHAMHSVVEWFAYAVWNGDGGLRRSLSLSPDSGVMENLGSPSAFEEPYWAGLRPLELDDALDDDCEDEEPYPLPFHPLEMAEDALRHLLGFTYEGEQLDGDPHLDDIVLAGFVVGST